MVSVLADDSGYGKMGQIDPNKKPSKALQWHDFVNVVALPILGTLCLLALLGYYDASKVTNMFIVYIAADLLWIWMEPETLPSLHWVIMSHHVITLLLLTFPYRHPDFAHFTCWDGITEINTFFLIARRHIKSTHRFFHLAYWITFIPLRLVLYPALMVRFWLVLEGYPLWERLLVVGCQFGLCCFNYGMFWLSVKRRFTKKPSKNRLVASAADAPAINRCTDRRHVKEEFGLRQPGRGANGLANGSAVPNGITASGACQEPLKDR